MKKLRLLDEGKTKNGIKVQKMRLKYRSMRPMYTATEIKQ